MTKRLITILCPVHNEQESIPLFYNRLLDAVSPLRGEFDFDLLFMNNGSTDATLDKIQELSQLSASSGVPIRVITLSRNFGYQNSLTCGLHHTRGDAVVIIDVDCEDPPEMIPKFAEQWKAGYDFVYGVRGGRPEGRGLLFMRRLFYRLTRSIADSDFILDMAEFSLFNDKVRRAVLQSRTTFPFIRTDLAYVGFRRKGIPYDRLSRIAGKTHYNYWRMTQFAIGGILSSSTFLLRSAAYVGLPLAALNLLGLIAWWFADIGLSSLIVLDLTYLIVFLSFACTYLARIYKDGLQRPLYVVDWDRSIPQAPSAHLKQ